MGLFDDVRIECPLPEGYPNAVYQTKDLDCTLSHYRITADGRLRMADPGPLTAFGHDAAGVLDYHGYLYLLYFGKVGDSRDGLRECRAKFTDGVCVQILPTLAYDDLKKEVKSKI
ncbi:MAG: hypothetical protein OXN15_00525 [Chloroflexota bacterium]|nr:hypothetical protein [Chloroflexota bacterium]MDE2970101.1 hypothetical protein [Chloroflexota bacterium]